MSRLPKRGIVASTPVHSLIAFVAREAGAEQVTMERIQAGFSFEFAESELPQPQEIIGKAIDFIMQHLGVTAP